MDKTDTRPMQQKLPYGLSNFKDVISEGYTYVDKTAYIPQLETHGKHHILLRPRRFGKSLFLSMLEHYYDRKYAADFEVIFGKLYIGQHPTALQSSYPVLFMEFSGIATTSTEDIYRAFNTKVELALQRFLERYGYAKADSEAIANVHPPMKKWRLSSQSWKGRKSCC